MRSYDQSSDPEFHGALNKLEACFGHFKEFNEEAMDEGPDLSAPGGKDEDQEFSQTCLTQINGLVDCLFDVLPAIDRLRQLWVLDLEKRSRELAVTLSSTPLVSTSQVSQLGQEELQRRASFVQSQDELNLSIIPREDISAGKGKEKSSAIDEPRILIRLEATQPEDSSSRESMGLKRQRRGLVSKERNKEREEQQQSIQDIVTMDLELATALRLSLVESQEQAARDRHETAAIMTQLKEWDEEIGRLKSWSELFEIHLGPSPSEAETKRLYSAYEQLAKIGRIFGRLPCCIFVTGEFF
jgi:hypothetical protein